MSDSNNISIKFNVDTTDASAEIGIRVFLNGEVIHENTHVKELYSVSHYVCDDDGEHELAIEMFGKQPTHTTIDEQNNIVKDALLTLNQFEFDDIDVTNVFMNIGEYHHDFNGTQAATVAKFYNNIGCNGTVKFKFKTPLYLWLLENM